MQKLLSKITIWLLKNKKLTGEHKALITTALLENIDALPIKEAITFNEQGIIVIKGKPVELELAKRIKEGADALSKNFADRIITEQILYKANQILLGITTVEQATFARAATWILQERERVIKQISEG